MLAGHVALFAWLGLRMPLDTSPPADELAAVEVFFLPRPQRPTRADRPTATFRPRIALPTPVGAVVQTDPLPAPESAAPSAPDAPSEAALSALRQTLRRSLANCLEPSRLSPEERTACQARMAQASRENAAIGPVMSSAEKQARFAKTAAAKEAWIAYEECETPAECMALYPGHRAAIGRLIGAQ